jgi:DDE superfamily endonuclease/Helix-turn-helix of DDE superfamily endonuclease
MAAARELRSTLPKVLLAQERPLRIQPITGLTDGQFSDLYERVDELFVWNCGVGRPLALNLREALIASLMYFRKNVPQDFIGALFDVSQPTVSRAIGVVEHMIDKALENCVPELCELMRGDTAIIDGTLLPCWSWASNPELFSGKHKTTGHNIQVVTNIDGELRHISDPLPGSRHDKKALDASGIADSIDIGASVADKGYQGTGAITPMKKPARGELSDQDKEFNSSVNRIRYVVERAIANIKTWRILHTDYRRPIKTFATSFRVIRALIFFTEGFE